MTKPIIQPGSSDSAALDAVSGRLGCGAVLELMARPAGTLARVWDPVRHVWGNAREVPTVDATLIDAVVIPTLQARTASTLDGGAADASAGDASAGDGKFPL